MIEDTSQRDPLLHLAGAMGRDGSTAYIEEIESAGQRQLVNSTMLPTEILGGAEDELTAVGIRLGDVDPNDPLFRHAELPEGWSKMSTEHAMWSKVVDQHGRGRAMVFYKAAPYDRRAHLRATSPASYAVHVVTDREPLVFDDWATADVVYGAIEEYRTEVAGYSHQDDWNAATIQRCDELLAAR